MTVLSASPQAAAAPLVLVEPTAGVYQPLFMTATGLAGVSGLAVASGGGLIAASAGTQGVGYLNLPATLDSTQPWRFGVLIEWNGDTTNYATVLLMAPTTVANYFYYTVGLQATNGANGTMTLQMGGDTKFFQGLGMTAGQRYWIFAASDGTTVTFGMMPYAHAGLNSTNPQNVATGTLGDVYMAVPATNVAHAVSTFTQFGTVRIQNSSTTTKVLGVYVQPGSYIGAPDARCQPPAIVQTTVSTDGSATVRLPRTYTGRQATDVVLLGHPNASNSQLGMNTGDPDTGTAIAGLVAAGFIVASILGDPSSSGYTSATASDWGAPAGLAYRRSLLSWIRSNLPNTRYVYWLGHSMGCLDGLMFHATYPGVLRALVGISGVTNLSDAYNNRGFSGVINTAYGVSALASIADRDPTLRPGLYTGLPTLLYHGTSDTLIPAAQHSAAFATAVNALGGQVTYTSVAGAGHLNVAGLWDAAGVLRFLRALSPGY